MLFEFRADAGQAEQSFRGPGKDIDMNPVQPIRGEKGAPIIGPTNPARETQSRDRLTPPSTDHGTLPSLKWSFADCHNRLQPGGWARQTTGRELQIAQALNCVNMRLKAGAVREMHWHKPDEWGFVIKGRMRVTAGWHSPRMNSKKRGEASTSCSRTRASKPSSRSSRCRT